MCCTGALSRGCFWVVVHHIYITDIPLGQNLTIYFLKAALGLKILSYNIYGGILVVRVLRRTAVFSECYDSLRYCLKTGIISRFGH